MRFLPTIAQRAAAEGLPFLIIGGNAVIAYGYQRHTIDIDFLVRDTHRQRWDELIVPMGYHAHHIARVFHMYNPKPGLDLPAFDLMLVNAQTFERLSAEAVEVVPSIFGARIPSLRHLIALKLHALRSGLEHRRERDLGDIVILMQINQIDLAASEYREIFDRYATPAIRDAVETRLAGLEPARPRPPHP